MCAAGGLESPHTMSSGVPFRVQFLLKFMLIQMPGRAGAPRARRAFPTRKRATVYIIMGRTFRFLYSFLVRFYFPFLYSCFCTFLSFVFLYSFFGRF